MAKRKFTDEQLTQAVANNITIKEILIELGLAPTGGNYKTIHRNVKKLELDTSHWNPKLRVVQALEKAREGMKLSMDEILVKSSDYNKARLKHRLVEEKILDFRCSVCGILSWLGEPLSLHLDHINGIRNDNRLENLRFLCPNCHSLTPTYCGKANKKPDKRCPDCGEKITRHSTRCINCARKERNKIEWPPTNELIEMVNKNSYVAIARSLGVSDNAIRKRIKTHPSN